MNGLKSGSSRPFGDKHSCPGNTGVGGQQAVEDDNEMEGNISDFEHEWPVWDETWPVLTPEAYWAAFPHVPDWEPCYGLPPPDPEDGFERVWYTVST